MIMCEIDLYDEIIIEKAKSFKLICAGIENEDNFVYKVIQRIEKEFKLQINLKITILKKIPSGGGLGGGSSNVATVLVFLNTYYNLKMNEKKLEEYVSHYGMDCPFFIKGQTQKAINRGEVLEDIENNISCYFILINPKIHISTKEVYENLKLTYHPNIEKIEEALKNDNYELFCKNIANNLEEYTLNKYKTLFEIKQTMLKYCDASIMSGSGATMIGITKNKENLKILEKIYLQYEVQIFKKRRK